MRSWTHVNLTKIVFNKHLPDRTVRNADRYLAGEQLTCESGGPDSLRLHLPLMRSSARFSRDALCCHDTNNESAPAFSVVQAPF